jgi:27-O-demethylrifamycin SV methyltransferase
MIERGQVTPDSNLLDVGCGIGAPACRVAREVGARVTGITTSRAGIEAAQRRAEAERLTGRVKFELRDGTDTKLDRASFDRVWVLESSHLMRNRDGLFSECARVLRTGGRLALCDIVLTRPLGFSEIRGMRGEFLLLREVFGDARMGPVSEYCQLAESHDLIVDTELDLTEATRPTFGHWRSNADRHRDAVSQILGHDGVDQFFAACDVLERFWDQRILGYALISAVKVTP